MAYTTVVTKAKRNTRCTQVKAAVKPAEKVLFEKVAAKMEVSLSDVIRNFLLAEAKRLRIY